MAGPGNKDQISDSLYLGSLHPMIGEYRTWEFVIKAGLFFFITEQLWRAILALGLPWSNFCYSSCSAFNSLQVLIHRSDLWWNSSLHGPFLLYLMENLKHFSVPGKIKFEHLMHIRSFICFPLCSLVSICLIVEPYPSTILNSILQSLNFFILLMGQD